MGLVSYRLYEWLEYVTLNPNVFCSMYKYINIINKIDIKN